MQYHNAARASLSRIFVVQARLAGTVNVPAVIFQARFGTGRSNRCHHAMTRVVIERRRFLASVVAGATAMACSPRLVSLDRPTLNTPAPVGYRATPHVRKFYRAAALL
jgi:hypothetical protein